MARTAHLTRNPLILRAACLSRLPWLRHGFTQRASGLTNVYGRPADLNLGMTAEDEVETVRQNRRIALRAVAADAAERGWTLVQTRQVHSTTVQVVSVPAASNFGPGDGLVTQLPGLMLGVLAADCVPILMADRRLRVVAAVHAGWRGTVESIVSVAVDCLSSQFGTNSADLVAAIGPSIGPCCYVVGDEVRTRFEGRFAYAKDLLSGGTLDLWEANRRQLLAAGLAPENIEVMGLCTACSGDAEERRFFSHRADKGCTGRMMGLIGIVPEADGGHPVASS